MDPLSDVLTLDPFLVESESDEDYIPQSTQKMIQTSIQSFLQPGSTQRSSKSQNSPSKNSENLDTTSPVVTSNNMYILDGKYFEVVRRNESNVEATCKLCLPVKRNIKGTSGTTSNFVTHLKRMHSEAYCAYLKEKEENKLKRKSVERKDVQLPAAKKTKKNESKRI